MGPLQAPERNDLIGSYWEGFEAVGLSFFFRVLQQ